MPETPNPGKGRSGIAYSFLGSVLTALALVFLLSKREAAAPVAAARPVPAPAPAAAPASLPHIVTASGRLQPFKEVKISPEVSGEIVELAVTEGQPVHKGDLLMRVKPDFYLSSRDEAQGNYKSAQANLKIADAHLQTARAEFKRNEDLLRNKLVSASAFEAAQEAYIVALAQRSSAEGQLETAGAALARAQYELEKTSVRSPIDGTVAKLNAEVGQRVIGATTMSGTEVMSITDLNEMEARVAVPEREIGVVNRGQKARLELSAFPGHTLEGTVQEIATTPEGTGAPASDGGPGGVEFEVRIRLQDKRFCRPGMSVTARIQGPPEMAGAAAPAANTKAPKQPWTS